MNDIKLIYGEKALSAKRDSLYRQQGRVYDSEGISPTLTTENNKNAHVMELKTGKDVAYTIDANYHKGTNTTLKPRRQLVMEQHTVAYSKSTRDTHIDVRGKVDGEANTISTGDGGRSMSSQNFVVDKELDMNCINPKAHESERIYKTDSEGPCLRATKGGTSGASTLIEDEIRIRKLTPLECERLQGYPDNHTKYGRKENGLIYEMSNTQRYKQCGNGVSSPVSKKIIESIIPEGEVRVFSTFTGIGGTELLLDDRFKVVGHCEIDKYASDVLRYNFPDIPNFHDVTKIVDRDDIPEFDLLIGGFPCQAFSIAGLRKGFDDEKGRGQLIYNIFDILKKHRPKYLCLENVKGLLSHNKGDSFEAILEFLSKLGYNLDFEVVNSKHFGLAQNRERVFIIGVLNES